MPQQAVPTTPAERRSQAAERQRWLDEWMARFVATDGKAMTLGWTRDA
jgi:hypothetical protein